jgi:hypothetical protein
MDTRVASSSIVIYRHQINRAQDPTSLPVSMAVMLYGVEPAAGDFKTAAWLTEGGRYYAVILIGQTGTGIGPLAEGIYKSWVKVTDTPEVPVLESPNYLVIT